MELIGYGLIGICLVIGLGAAVLSILTYISEYRYDTTDGGWYSGFLVAWPFGFFGLHGLLFQIKGSPLTENERQLIGWGFAMLLALALAGARVWLDRSPIRRHKSC